MMRKRVTKPGQGWSLVDAQGRVVRDSGKLGGLFLLPLPFLGEFAVKAGNDLAIGDQWSGKLGTKLYGMTSQPELHFIVSGTRSVLGVHVFTIAATGTVPMKEPVMTASGEAARLCGRHRAHQRRTRLRSRQPPAYFHAGGLARYTALQRSLKARRRQRSRQPKMLGGARPRVDDTGRSEAPTQPAHRVSAQTGLGGLTAALKLRLGYTRLLGRLAFLAVAETIQEVHGESNQHPNAENLTRQWLRSQKCQQHGRCDGRVWVRAAQMACGRCAAGLAVFCAARAMPIAHEDECAERSKIHEIQLPSERNESRDQTNNESGDHGHSSGRAKARVNRRPRSWARGRHAP